MVVARMPTVGVACLTGEGRWSALDAEAGALLGVDPDAAIGQRWELAFAPEDADPLRVGLERARAEGKWVARVHDAAGAERELTLVASADAPTLCLVRGCAGARARLRELEVLTRLDDEVLGWSPPREIYERALDAVCQLTGADRAALLLFDEDGVMRFEAWRGLSDGYRAAVEGHTPWPRGSRPREAIAVPDVAQAPDLKDVREVILAEGIRAVAFVPIVSDGGLVGKFMLYYDRSHPFTPDELRLATTLANHVGFTIDCSGRDQALRESEARFRDLANSVPLIVWSADAGGESDFFNDRALWFTGCSRQALLGSGWLATVHPDDRQAVLAARDSSLRTGHEYVLEMRLRRWDGRYLWHLVQGRPVRDAGGAIARWYGTCTEIDEQRLARDALARQARELSEADRRKDDFLAVLGHELRNPLAAIQSGLRVLRMGDPAREAWAKDTIDAHARQVARILDDLLDLSRVTRGKVALERRWVAAGEVLQRAVEAALPAVEERRQELRVDVEPQLRLFADPDRLAQVVVNLLTNAARYTPPGGRISLGAALEQEQVVIRVRDTGVGIAPELREQIFEPFRQGQGTPYAPGGLGIGLTLVRELTHLHGGSVEVISGEGLGGSEFVVRVPQGTPPAEAPSAPAAPVREGATEGMPVLVVEDHPDLAMGLSILLELELGCRVTVTHDGASALRAAFARPAAAIIDIGLPDMTGFDLARELRRRLGPEVLLIALSGFGHDAARAEAERAGFDHHLAKPADPAVLKALLARHAAQTLAR